MSKIISNNTATLLAKLTDTAYKTEKNLDEAIKKVPTGWKVLANSNGANDIAAHFNAIAFINEETKEICIAHAGTKFFDGKGQAVDDFLADGVLAAKEIPMNKLAAIKTFVKEVTESKTESDIKEYSFVTTGHSLGGLLANLTAIELKSLGLNITHSDTFDNPGTAPLVDTDSKLAVFSGAITTEQVKEIKFTSYQAPTPNLVNRANEQLGTVKTIIQKPSVIEPTTKENVEKLDSSASYVSYLFNKVGSVASSAVKSLNLHSMANLCSDISSFYEKDKLSDMKKSIEIIKTGLVEKYKDCEKLMTNISDDIKKITVDIATIGAGAASIYSGNYASGASLFAKGLYDGYNNTTSLFNNAMTAFNNITNAANSIKNISSHSLNNFHNGNNDNIFTVKSGYGSGETKLVLEVSDNMIEKIKSDASRSPVKDSSSMESYFHKSFETVDLCSANAQLHGVEMSQLQYAIYGDSMNVYCAGDEDVSLAGHLDVESAPAA